MKFDILTLFPEIFEPVINSSIIGRALKKGLIEIKTHNIRDYSLDKHRKTDDYPYGGGCGMVMTPQPIYDAYKAITKDLDYKPKVIYMSPQGKVLTQKKALQLRDENHLIILCGHYEGVDERIIEKIVDEEISIGDYVLTGGELPAMVLIDCISRLVPGVLSNGESYSDESHFNGLLEYPQYTRPYDFMGSKVPDVLLSGNHKDIERWRRIKSLVRTYEKRPDLFEKLSLDEDELKQVIEEVKSKNNNNIKGKL